MRGVPQRPEPVSQMPESQSASCVHFGRQSPTLLLTKQRCSARQFASVEQVFTQIFEVALSARQVAPVGHEPLAVQLEVQYPPPGTSAAQALPAPQSAPVVHLSAIAAAACPPQRPAEQAWPAVQTLQSLLPVPQPVTSVPATHWVPRQQPLQAEPQAPLLLPPPPQAVKVATASSARPASKAFRMELSRQPAPRGGGAAKGRKSW